MQCLRDILGLTLCNSSYNADVLEECGEATMRDQPRLKKLQWSGHLMRMPIHRPQRQILMCRPQGKRRPPGGIPLRWIDVVHKDLASLCNWHQMVNDRTTWRAFIHHSLDGDPTISEILTDVLVNKVYRGGGGGGGVCMLVCVCVCVCVCV